MNKPLLIVLFLFVLISCRKSENELDKPPIINNNENVFNLAPEELGWGGIVVHFYPIRGLITNRKYLNTTIQGDTVNLSTTDDLSGRQQWLLQSTGNGSYNIRVYSGLTTARQLLSVNSNGHHVDLWNIDDNSGRQKWYLDSVSTDNIYRVRVAGGINSSRKLLSFLPDGSKVDLYDIDDGTGRQHWKIEAIGEYDLVDLQYKLSSDDRVKSKPDFVTQVTVTNNSSTARQTTISFPKKAIESSSHIKTAGIPLKIGATQNVKVPGVFDGIIKTDLTSFQTWQYGSSQSREDTQPYSLDTTIPANATVVAKAIVTMNELSANYLATFKSRKTGALKKIQGRWTGIQAGNVHYQIQ